MKRYPLTLATLLLTTLALGACADGRTYMKNPTTGQVVTCGTRHPYTVVESAVEQREAQCIQDYKEQGFVRVPGPDSK
jgi:hypothetical protein